MSINGITNIGYCENAKFIILQNHIGTISSLLKTIKITVNNEFLKDLKSIITYAIATVSKCDQNEARKGFKNFEVLL